MKHNIYVKKKNVFRSNTYELIINYLIDVKRINTESL